MEEQKTINAQLSQRICTMESSLNKKFDVLQSDLDQKFDNLQYSISRLTNQHIHLEAENPEKVCLSDTMVEEQCQQQLQEGLIENFAKYSEGLFESSTIGAVVCPWEKNSPMLTEEGSGKDVVDEPQEHKLHLPSTDLVYPVYTLPAAQPIREEPAPAAEAKAIPPSLTIQYFRKLVASVQTFATTSKTLAAAHTAWHNGWFGCWFRFEAPGS